MLDDLQRFPITAILCIGALAAFAADASGRSVEHMVLSAPLVLEEPWRLLTTVFPHGGLVHLLFNLLWTWQLGRALEHRLGTAGMLILVLVTAVSASALQLVFGGRPVGLSGVVYGLAAYGWMRGRRDPRFAGMIDESTRNLLVAWFFVCIGLTWVGALNIANAAHAGGALIGLALGTGRPWLTPLIVTLIGTSVLFRTSIPVRDPDAALWMNVGVERAEEGDLEKALYYFEQATLRDPELARAWMNLGIARRELGDPAGAEEAFLEVARRDLSMLGGPGVQARYAARLRAQGSPAEGLRGTDAP